MITARSVAEYFLSKDPDRKLFNKNVVVYNDRKFYEGNARLNKYLFLSQVVYMAKYGHKLFEDDFCAFDTLRSDSNIKLVSMAKEIVSKYTK